ncbi:MAG: ATP-binding protein [Kineosporiaceae bacterium]|nr:ATP-binding protein [Aeromicrobium sp.]
MSSPSSPSPFRAGFGKVPPTLAGRSKIIRAFAEAIEVGAWGSERALLVRGLRGVGKTVLLETLRRQAEDAGWVTISETASDGFVVRIMNKLREAITLRQPSGAVKISSIGIAPIGHIGFVHPEPSDPPATLEGLVEKLAGLVEPTGGILFTLDEVSAATMKEFGVFAGSLQRSISRDHEIAMICAGLHTDIATILRDGTSTFLRRAHNENLDFLSWEDTLDAISTPIHAHGRTISPDALDYAARATQGYPFLTQYIGDKAWKENQNEQNISLADVKTAARLSKRQMGANIHEPALGRLSIQERTLLAAMAQDDGPSAIAELRQRLGSITPQHLNNIRSKLVDAGIVYAPQRGKLDFALPYLRDYLREHTVTDAMNATGADLAKARAAFPPPPTDL